MVELVYTHALEACAARIEGSSPSGCILAEVMELVDVRGREPRVLTDVQVRVLSSALIGKERLSGP